jgi:hypothetical protein
MAHQITPRQIQSNLFIRIQIDEYRTTPTGSYTQQILRFSDLNENFTINNEVYLGLGNFMNIGASRSEIRASSGELTIGISGIPNSAIAEIVNSKIKGAPVRVFRALRDPSTGTLLNLGSVSNPMGRFRGFVNNYSLTEDWDPDSRTSSNTINIVCASSVDVLERKTAGRLTNPASMKKFYPNDASFDRVPNLENATFDFGVPK